MLGWNIESKFKIILWFLILFFRYFETLRIDNAVLAAFEDEYGDSELKRKAGAEKIYQIHTMKGRSWWCLQNVPFLIL